MLDFRRARNTPRVPSDDHTPAGKAAASELRFREANERFRAIVGSYRFEAKDRVPFVCECADPGCFENVMLSLEEYDRVRANPTWFLLVAGHEDPEASCERIVEAENGYAIVEKIGVAGAEAARLHRGDRGTNARRLDR